MIAAVPILDDLRKLTKADPRANYVIAEASGIHPTTFSAFLAGKRGLSVESAEKLADVLGHPLQTVKRKGDK